jgi:hypothetical protein
MHSYEENCLADSPAQNQTLQAISSMIPGLYFDLHKQCQAETKDDNSYYCGVSAGFYLIYENAL